jgi:hypothetical protein
MSLSITDIAIRFGAQLERGGNYKARCPVHDDNKPSLEIKAGDNGGVLVLCRVCGKDATSAILSAVGLKMADLAPPNLNGNGHHHHNGNGKPKKEIEATYDYTDENGRLLFQKIRYRPKSFSLWQPDGNGGKTWNMQGARRVLYKLPRLIAADPEQFVLIVEGEKDVERAEKLGFLATCNFDGAKKWLPEYNEFFRGRNVVIVPDNDTEGRSHQEIVARNLVGTAASVRVLALPGLPDKGDLSDWADAGGTDEQLGELAEAAPLWRPGQEPAAEAKPEAEAVHFHRLDIDELLDGDFRVKFIVDGILVAGQPLLIGGMQKTLKTNILLDAAVSLASQTPMLGKFEVRRSLRVGVMTGESGLGTIQETVSRIMRAKGIDREALRGRLFITEELPQAADARHHAALKEFLERDKIEFVAIDPAYLCMPSEENGNLFKQGPVLRMMAETCRQAGAASALCHHTRPIPDHRPAELADLAWAGFKEFARQWWLLNRREDFDPDSAGEHKLWLTVGGSAGFNSLWGVDVIEGRMTDAGGRKWELDVQSATDSRGRATKQREEVKANKAAAHFQAKVETAKERIKSALRTIDGNADTLDSIKTRSGCKGAAFDEALAHFLRVGAMVETEVVRGNKQTYKAYRYEFTKDNQ